MQDLNFTILKYVCFGCGIINRQFNKNDKSLKIFYNEMVSDFKCSSCQSDKYIFKTAYGLTIELDENALSKTKKKK